LRAAAAAGAATEVGPLLLGLRLVELLLLGLLRVVLLLHLLPQLLLLVVVAAVEQLLRRVRIAPLLRRWRHGCGMAVQLLLLLLSLHLS
jgi:hypothetical protein